MIRNTLPLAIAGFLLFGAVASTRPADASVVSVMNPSFEDPAVGDGGFTVGINDVPGWTLIVSGGAGVFDPNGQITPTDGVQVAYVNPSPGASPEGELSQILSEILTANTRYTLLVDVGARNDTTFGGYTVNLYAGSTLLASDVNGEIPSSGEWITSTVTYTSAGTGPLLGQALQIELRYGPGTGVQTLFDNVRLDATAVPEASSVAIWSIFGLAVAVLRAFQKRWHGEVVAAV